MRLHIYIISFILIITGNQYYEKKLSLKTFAEEAIYKSIVGIDPIIVANPFSAKIYSKLDLRHPAWNNLKREQLIIIPKNSDSVEKLWGKQAFENGVIVFRAAEDKNYDVKKLKYILNGKEISIIGVDTIDMKIVNSLIVVKDRNSEERVAFIDTTK